MAVALLLACGQLRAADVRDGIVSYWPLDSISGGTTPDLVFTNAMNVFGTPTVSPGKFGNAFTFANHIYLTNLHAPDAFPTTGLPIYNAGAYTICMWVKGTNQTAKYLYTEGNLTSANTLVVLQTGNAAANNNKFDVIIRTDANTTILNHAVSTKVVFDDTWHHIAWVDDNGNARLYVDGELDPTNFSYTRGGTFTLHTSAIGTLVRTGVAGTAVFNGQIDEVITWERPLSQAEVQAVMASGIATPISSSAPSIHVEPVATTRHLGDWAVFSTRAYALRPHNVLNYQWYRNGNPIPGATSRTYQTEHLTPANSGEYFSVTVDNGIGSPVSSSNAVLTVLADPPAAVQEGLMNYWPLDIVQEQNGNLTTPDLYSKADMALTNEMTIANLVDGRIGKALIFDGLTNIAYRTSGTPITINPNYSISMWVKGDFQFQNDRRVFSEGSPTNNNPLVTIGTQSDGQGPAVSMFARNEAGVAQLNGRRSLAPAFDDTWHHIVYTDSNGQGRLYIDGVLDMTDFTYTPAPRTVSQTSLGGVMRGLNTGNFFFGSIDDVGAWNRALTWTEVQAIYANGIPEPVSEIPPAFVTQPVSRTNNTWVGQNVTFSASVSGTAPSFQWFKNDSPILASQNPSAATLTLVLTNIQLSDNGSYYLRASNSAGTTNSETVQLLARTYTPTTTGEVLKIDVGSDLYPNQQPGFDVFTLGVNGNSYGVVGVTVSPIGNIGMASRNRPNDASVWVTDAPPHLTQASIYNDFIYANNNSIGNGMQILIERLAPNTPYGVTIWSFDRNSAGERTSDWVETSSGTPKPVISNYTWNGTNAPTADYQYTMGGLFTSSPAGTLQFEGRNVSATLSVFFNAMRLVAAPVGTQVKELGMVDGKLRIRVVGDYQGQPITLQESSTLAPGSWGAVADSEIIRTEGPAVTFEVPVGGARMFYRAVSHPTW